LVENFSIIFAHRTLFSPSRGVGFFKKERLLLPFTETLFLFPSEIRLFFLSLHGLSFGDRAADPRSLFPPRSCSLLPGRAFLQTRVGTIALLSPPLSREPLPRRLAELFPPFRSELGYGVGFLPPSLRCRNAPFPLRPPILNPEVAAPPLSVDVPGLRGPSGSSFMSAPDPTQPSFFPQYWIMPLWVAAPFLEKRALP